MASWTVESFGPELVTKEGVVPTATALAGKSRIALYFSAHWCPPCRGFTPVLAEFYDQLAEEDPSQLAIIFVSSDSDQSSFNQYYGTMPWFSIPFGAKQIETLGQKFHISGIPALIVLDAADGAIKDADGRSTVAASKGVTSKATSKWA